MTWEPSAITVATVRRLIEEQFPRYAGLEVRALRTNGTVNAIFAVGPDLVARFPLQVDDPAQIARELHQEAVTQQAFAEISPVPCPQPRGIGTPGHGVGHAWALQTWVPGDVATPDGLADSPRFAEDLADLVLALRAVDTAGRTFGGHGRGGALTDHDDWVGECLERSEGLLDVPRLRGLWTELRETPATDRLAMSHTDLIPGNLLVRGGRLVGVIDTGGYGAADEALDLIVGLHLLEAPARTVFRGRVGAEETAWRRALAWAFEQAVGLVWYYRESLPEMSTLGRSTLRRITEEMPGR
ncbi:phosphotransferase [Brachybacterium sacelli]|uniref:Aminoglycoside phosphotransferase (APT) family kinase protein n=1 Tax=Brachybacterium sacelli TaxID=173364 RepID=A0ABS4X048_9MICO|nr:phosphotransferase [Brachybacterium sacelli]MBP2381751.1 aminoglycoside phosphotransferase (APT) family kinase protein [Brachybacterium sacelli]